MKRDHFGGFAAPHLVEAVSNETRGKMEAFQFRSVAASANFSIGLSAFGRLFLREADFLGKASRLPQCKR
jgi:hypothetical protein